MLMASSDWTPNEHSFGFGLCIVYKISDPVHSFFKIGADGPQSLVRQQASMDCLSWKYDQIGVVATLQLGEVVL